MAAGSSLQVGNRSLQKLTCWRGILVRKVTTCITCNSHLVAQVGNFLFHQGLKRFISSSIFLVFLPFILKKFKKAILCTANVNTPTSLEFSELSGLVLEVADHPPLLPRASALTKDQLVLEVVLVPVRPPARVLRVRLSGAAGQAHQRQQDSQEHRGQHCQHL